MEAPAQSSQRLQHTPSIVTLIRTDAAQSLDSHPRYYTYKEYLDDNTQQWPELRWMLAFFAHPSGPGGTTVTIVESKDGKLDSQKVQTTDPPNLQTTLEN
jgi:hypothetical protein